MTFNQISNIVEIAKYKSISKASVALQLPQSHLSNHIKALEEELDIKIFNRSKDGITLTESGELFLIHAHDILGRHQTLLNIKETQKLQSFSVSAPPISFCTDAFTILCARHDKLGRLRFSLQHYINEIAIPYLMSADIDISIMLINDIFKHKVYEQCKLKKINLEPVGKLPINLYMRKNHPILQDELDKNSTFPYSKLIQYPYVDYVENKYGLTLREVIKRMVNDISFGDSDNIILVSEPNQKDSLILNTDAYSVGIERSSTQKNENMVNMPIPNCFFTIYIATSSAKKLTKLAEEYKEILIQELQKSPEFINI